MKHQSDKLYLANVHIFSHCYLVHQCNIITAGTRHTGVQQKFGYLCLGTLAGTFRGLGTAFPTFPIKFN